MFAIGLGQHRSWSWAPRLQWMAAITVALFFICGPLFSQVSNGRILGTATDSSGAAIAGATVVVTNTQTNTSRTLTTDSAGAYVASALIPGTYSLKASAGGFQTAQVQNVVVEVGKDTRADIYLQVGSTSQTVTVTEEAPLVDTTNAVLGGTMSNTQITDLPLNGRNFEYLTALRPGIVIQPGGSSWTPEHQRRACRIDCLLCGWHDGHGLQLRL
jgi:hypothetical protein